MPVYEYLCGDCGPFTDTRPMAECDLPSNCPACSATAPRVLLTAPRLSQTSSVAFRAAAVNARSASAPRLKSSHGSGCSCCTGMMRRGREAANSGTNSGVKGFPGRRPWMISH